MQSHFKISKYDSINIMKSIAKNNDTPIFDTTRYSNQSSKNNELVKSLKNCTQQVILIYKFCQIPPKTIDSVKDVLEYCKNLQKMLKTIVEAMPKVITTIQAYEMVKKDYKQKSQQYQKVLQQLKQYKCQLSVLETKLMQAETRQRKLTEQKIKQKQYAIEFQNKINRIKKDSQDGLKKIIQVSRGQEHVRQRNNSLPSLKTYANKQKMGLLLLMDSYKNPNPKHQNLISYMKRQF